MVPIQICDDDSVSGIARKANHSATIGVLTIDALNSNFTRERHFDLAGKVADDLFRHLLFYYLMTRPEAERSQKPTEARMRKWIDDCARNLRVAA